MKLDGGICLARISPGDWNCLNLGNKLSSTLWEAVGAQIHTQFQVTGFKSHQGHMGQGWALSPALLGAEGNRCQGCFQDPGGQGVD